LYKSCVLGMSFSFKEIRLLTKRKIKKDAAHVAVVV
jgi:hypothetical protein